MNDIDELDLLHRLADDQAPPTSEVRDHARARLLDHVERPSAVAGDLAERRSPRRRRLGVAVGVTAAGIAAAVAAVALIAGPDLPGGIGARAASAEQQLRDLAQRLETKPFPAYPYVENTRRTSTAAAGAVTSQSCVTIVLDAANSANRCDSGPAGLPAGVVQASAVPLTATTDPADVRAIVDSYVDGLLAKAAANGTPADRTHYLIVSIGLALTQSTLSPEIRAELLRLIAEVPGLTVDRAAETPLGDSGTRFEVATGTGGNWAVTLDPADGFVLGISFDNGSAAQGDLPRAESLAFARPTAATDLPPGVIRIRDLLAQQGPSIEANDVVANPHSEAHVTCGVAIDPAVGTYDPTAFDGWDGEHCTYVPAR